MRILTVLMLIAFAIPSLAEKSKAEKQAMMDARDPAMFITEDTDEFDPGLAIGTPLPAIAVQGPTQTWQSLEAFSGPKGLVIVAVRSVEWCPFCMKQLVNLNGQLAEFAEAGLNIVGITYDSPQAQQQFREDFDIGFPLLSDSDAKTFSALGILHQDYAPGDDHYGIPYPGSFVLSPEGVIVGKQFLDGYRERVDAAAILAYAKESLVMR